jgi:hypothetical protein
MDEDRPAFLPDMGRHVRIKLPFACKRIEPNGNHELAEQQALFGVLLTRLAAGASVRAAHSRPQFGHPHAEGRTQVIARARGRYPKKRWRWIEHEVEGARGRSDRLRRRADRIEEILER